MNPKLFGFAVVLFLHNLFAAVWMGGMITTLLSFSPAVREVLGAGPQTKKIMSTYQKKQGILVYISIVGLALTGVLLSNRSPEFVRLFSFGNPYSIALSLKHIIVLIMIAIALYRSLVLGRQKGPSSPAREKLNIRLLIINVVLAVLVILDSAVVTALATRPPGA